MFSSNINEVTSKISPNTLQEVISENIPYIQESLHSPKEMKNWSSLLFTFITKINLQDPRTYLGELPMFSLFDTEITAASADVDFNSIPIESPPPPEIEKQIQQGVAEEDDSASEGSAKSQVFIYNTHFWEAYLPELKEKDPTKAWSWTNNVRKVGRHLQSTLEQNGIDVVYSKKPQTGWNQAYQHSREIVVSAMKQNPNLKYFIDLHRDSRRRSQTTIEIDGKPYARLAFVLGKESKYYRQNKEISEFLCTEINKEEKGLCKAVFTKQRTKETNGEYNQSLSPHSMLIEVGGVDNTFQEAYRSMEILAKVLIEKLNHGFLSHRK